MSADEQADIDGFLCVNAMITVLQSKARIFKKAPSDR
jgi:hypothetical protein